MIFRGIIDISFLKLTTSSDGKVTKEKESSFEIKLKGEKEKKGEVYIQLSPKEEKTFSTINKKLYKDNNKSTTLYLKGDKKIDSSKLTLKAFVITKEMVNSVASGKGEDATLLNALNKYAPIYEVNTPLRVAHFLAQVAHESKDFTDLNEGTKYSRKNAMNYPRFRNLTLKEQDNYFTDKQPELSANQSDPLSLFSASSANQPPNRKYAKQPDFFNLRYGGRFGNDNNNDDGYTYRGRGLIQLTFKDNYKAINKTYNKKNPDNPKDFVKDPDLVSKDMEHAVESAFIYWEWRKINDLATGTNETTIKAVTKKVNGGSEGIEERKVKFKAIATHLKLI